MMIAFWCRVVSILLGNCRCLLPLEILISSSDFVACVQPFKLAPLKTRGSYQRSNSFANEHYRKPRVTTGNRGYAVCHRVCRVPNIGHSANRTFTECRLLGTQQTRGTWYISFLPCAGTQQRGATRDTPSLPSAFC